MRQVILSIVILLAGVLLLAFLWMGMFPPHPHTQPVDHVVPLPGVAAPASAH